jgi:hypothetical protein
METDQGIRIEVELKTIGRRRVVWQHFPIEISISPYSANESKKLPEEQFLGREIFGAFGIQHSAFRLRLC